MSYDLHVYSSEELDQETVIGLLTDVGLAVDGLSSEGSVLTVARGAKRAYSFTIGLAAPLESEDVPDEVTTALLDPRYLYEVMIEGTLSSEVVHAVRFARKLAQASKGVVVDEQEGTLWSRGKMRTPPKVERGLIDLVEIRWWVTDRSDPAESAARWLDVARRHLPEALPRRWGVYETPLGKGRPRTP